MLIYDYIFIFIVLTLSGLGLLFGIVKSFSKFFTLLIPLFISIFSASKFNTELIAEYSFYNGPGSFFITSILLYIILYLFSKLFFFLIESFLIYLNLSLLNRLIGCLSGLVLGAITGIIFLLGVKRFFNIETLFYNKIKGYLSFFFTI
ncbi:hypothetical protein CL651_004595 [bacterium]|nr:hypothetical protein [bacterium]